MTKGMRIFVSILWKRYLGWMQPSDLEISLGRELCTPSLALSPRPSKDVFPPLGSVCIQHFKVGLLKNVHLVLFPAWNCHPTCGGGSMDPDTSIQIGSISLSPWTGALRYAPDSIPRAGPMYQNCPSLKACSFISICKNKHSWQCIFIRIFDSSISTQWSTFWTCT